LCLSHRARWSGKEEVPRTLTIHYPDGQREYWFTDRVFQPGDLLKRATGSWVVESVGDPNDMGKHTTIFVQPGRRSNRLGSSASSQVESPSAIE
jgi:hypothetical protein